MDLIFNDLSTKHSADDINVARNRMEQLVQLIKQSGKPGAPSTFYTNDNFLYEELGPGYRISNWLNDGSVDMELRRFLKSRVDRRPYIKLPDEQFLQDEMYLHEFRYQNSLAHGLAISHFRDGLSVSLSTADHWNTPYLIVLAKQYLADSDEVVQKEVVLRHATHTDHLTTHAEWLNLQYQQQQSILKVGIKNGPDLTARVDELFPSLEFCNRVMGQLQDIQRGNPRLQTIIQKLFELEEYFSKWGSGAFDSNQLRHCTPESESNLNQYAKQYEFECPDGVYRTFDWHIRFTPGAGRIFFIPDKGTRKAIIGHIGDKIAM